MCLCCVLPCCCCSYVVSTDKDAKVRVSILPAQPLKGAYEIQSYCMGHTAFVTQAVWLPLMRGQQGENLPLLLVSGGYSTST